MSNGKSTPQIFILIGCCLVLAGLIISYPKPTQAEIATPKDWIGLFPTGAADGKTNTVTSSNATFIDGHMWVYANSCTQTAGANPKLTDPTGCPFAFNPTPTSGTYEFRLYANDQETADALIAKSNTLAASPTPGPAVNCPTQTAYPRVQDGLITASGTSNNFGNPAANCVLGSPAPFASFKIPTYDDLKSIYFTQSKDTGTPPPVQSVEIHYKACATLGGNSDNQIKSNLGSSSGIFKTGSLTSLTNQCPTYQEFTDTFTTNPSGGAWTSADVNDLQIGIENQGGGGDDRRVTKIWAVVNYASSNEALTPTAESIVAGKNDWILGAGASKTSTITSDDGDTSYLKRGAIWGGDPSPHYQWFEVSNLTGALVNKTALTCNPCTQTDIPMTGGRNRLYLIPNDLNLNGNLTGTGESGVVFVEGNLSVNQNITYGGPSTGVVFVVKGDINIKDTVDRIDAILISQGAIYTAGASCTTNSVLALALTINGSLISLNTIDNAPIKFCRTLAGNSAPAEKVINQPKYLVILRNLMSDTYQKWAEIQ